MSYQLYRNTTLGHTLQEALDELMQLQVLSPRLAMSVLLQFDRSINSALGTRVKSKVTFRAEKLNTYRFCDNVWTFMLNDVSGKRATRHVLDSFYTFTPLSPLRRSSSASSASLRAPTASRSWPATPRRPA